MAMHVTVVAADRAVWSGEAERVVAKTVEGEIGILTGHEPVLALIAEGNVRIVTTSGEHLRVDAHGGFLSVEDNHVNVVADQAKLV